MSRHWLLSGAKLLDSVEATFLRQAITCTGGVVGAVRIKELLPVRAFGNTQNFVLFYQQWLLSSTSRFTSSTATPPKMCCGNTISKCLPYTECIVPNIQFCLTLGCCGTHFGVLAAEKFRTYTANA